MNIRTWLITGLFALIGICAMQGMAATETVTIKNLLNSEQEYLNKKVTVQGYVENPTVLAPDNPMDKILGSFELVDKDSIKITVYTEKKKLPAAQETITVTGFVQVTDGTMTLLQKSGINGGGTVDPPPLIPLIAGLVIVAIILIVLLMKPSKISTVVEPPLPLMNCPNCGAGNAFSAKYCENCGGIMRPGRTTPQPIRTDPIITVSTNLAKDTRIWSPILAHLTVVSGEGSPRGTEFDLSGDKQILIGRGQGDIQLDDEFISREHSRVWMENDHFFIQDAPSKSGTLVNGQKVTRHQLNDRDVIQLGHTKLVFSLVPTDSI